MHALARPRSWIAALGLGRRPAEPVRMQQCLLLAGLLHLWLVLLVGNTTGGTAPPGDGVWGRLNITLQGPVNGSPDGDPAALPRHNGPRGTAPQERFGGAVREQAQTPAATTPPGAAQLGPWAPKALPPVSADADAAAPPAAPARPAAQTPVARQDAAPVAAPPARSEAPAAPAPVAPVAPDVPAAPPAAVSVEPLPAPDPAPSIAKLKAPASTVQRLSAPALIAPKSAVMTPSAADLQTPVLAPLSPAPTLKQFDAAAGSPALERVRPDAALLKAKPASSSNVPPSALTGPAAQTLSALPQLPPLQHQLPRLAPQAVPAPPPMPDRQAVQALPAPATSLLQAAPALTTPPPMSNAAPLTSSPAAIAEQPKLAPAPAAVPAPVPESASERLPERAPAPPSASPPPLKSEPAPQAEPSVPSSLSPHSGPSLNGTSAPPRLGSPSGASLAAKDGKAAASSSSTSLPPPENGAVGLTGAPDAGSQLGRDLATPPSAVSELPQAPARLNLSLPTRPRGGELSGRGSRGALDLLPTPPEQKSKLAQDLEKAGKQDCRQAYGGAGLLAVVPLALDAVRDKGCRW